MLRFRYNGLRNTECWYFVVKKINSVKKKIKEKTKINLKDKRYLKYYVYSTGGLTESWNIISQPTTFVKRKKLHFHSITGALQTFTGP